MTTQEYQGNDRLLLGMVLGVITFWLFAQTTLNIAPTMRTDLGIDVNNSNIAVSITALFSGIFIVVFGDLGDRFGRLKMTKIGIILSILGSLLIAASPRGTIIFLMTGRIIQGLSAACIMPSTLALIKAYYQGASRQRAISFWSIGSWGGSGFCSLFGGIVASTIGWRWIFWFSILIAIVSYLLIRETPESKKSVTDKVQGFDFSGVLTFMIGMVAINIVIGLGARIGWSSSVILGLAVLAVAALYAFFRIERSKENRFIDFNLFSNKTYTGATISNFLLNGAAGTIIVALTVVQLGAGLTSFQAGLLTIGYLVAILLTIRVGEKLLQRWGARKPMVLGCIITGAGILLTSFTFVLAQQYMIIATIGFTLFGIGLGFYATPSTDAALSTIPTEKAGSASGIYKMASSLGAALGVAISAALFTGLSDRDVHFTQGIFWGRTSNISIRYAAAIALLFNLGMLLVAIISIMMTVPAGKSETIE
ncbi:MFS transporter [Ruminiclostridium cellulolyticum]|uniref:Major facilitator superfamily MFS_1 n=1 Tax=Ruminiclostridium cellulolyticum (strain ATCC 35319 / DSM 5812 / JCM 6584 / H10) TaxID=394503 RepID=B8I9C4_RUMCH|nr:MFS transporter [Ruminiclostridium cellulolyticum]ACL75384.1 major facilitator superfamily MFS_1 [Ruminiclostridium cellulolyticum H10]